jgi:hypothetical protein
VAPARGPSRSGARPPSSARHTTATRSFFTARFDLKDLAFAAQIPIGVELLPGAEPASKGLRVTGLTVRDALIALMAVDPRYDWREFDGVIVVRPVLGVDRAGPSARTRNPRGASG